MCHHLRQHNKTILTLAIYKRAHDLRIFRSPLSFMPKRWRKRFNRATFIIWSGENYLLRFFSLILSRRYDSRFPNMICDKINEHIIVSRLRYTQNTDFYNQLIIVVVFKFPRLQTTIIFIIVFHDSWTVFFQEPVLLLIELRNTYNSLISLLNRSYLNWFLKVFSYFLSQKYRKYRLPFAIASKICIIDIKISKLKYLHRKEINIFYVPKSLHTRRFVVENLILHQQISTN